jgi:hypothetical protein
VKHCPLGGSLQCWYERTVRWLRMTSCDSVSKILFSVVPSHIFLDGDLGQPTKETEVAGCTDCSLSSNDCGFREDDRYYVDNDVQGSSDTGIQLQYPFGILSGLQASFSFRCYIVKDVNDRAGVDRLTRA